MGILAALTQGTFSGEVSSCDVDEMLRQGCTIISLPFVTPGWINGVGVLVFGFSSNGSEQLPLKYS